MIFHRHFVLLCTSIPTRTYVRHTPRGTAVELRNVKCARRLVVSPASKATIALTGCQIAGRALRIRIEFYTPGLIKMIPLKLLITILGGLLIAPETLIPVWRSAVIAPSLTLIIIIIIVVALILVIVALLISLWSIPLILVPPSASSPAALKATTPLISPSSAAAPAATLEPASLAIKIPPPVRLRAILVDIFVERVGTMGLLIEEFFCFVCIEMTTIRIEKTTLPGVAEFLMPLNGALSAVLISAITVSMLIISTVLTPGLPAVITTVCIVIVTILALSAVLILAVTFFVILEMNIPITLELVSYLHSIQRVIHCKRVNVLLVG